MLHRIKCRLQICQLKWQIWRIRRDWEMIDLDYAFGRSASFFAECCDAYDFYLHLEMKKKRELIKCRKKLNSEVK